MAYDDYEASRVHVDQGIARVTLDHPPINLIDLALILELRPVVVALAIRIVS